MTVYSILNHPKALTSAGVIFILLSFSLACRDLEFTAPQAANQATPQVIQSDDGTNKIGQTKVATYPEVADFLKSNCAQCHGVDSKGNNAQYYSVWPLNDEVLEQNKFMSDASLPAVYMALLNKINPDPATKPAAMPIGIENTPNLQEQILSVLAWLELNLPIVVKEAEEEYQSSNQLKTGSAELSFICENPLTNRNFINRLSLSAYDRPVDIAQAKALFTEKGWQLDQRVSPDVRNFYVQQVFQENLELFKSNGLKNLATAISASSAITLHPQLSDNQVADLKEEFYQLLSQYFDRWEYPKFFSSNTVMVTEHTAPLYGCPSPSKTVKWSECFMLQPREGFFTTFGFLNSKRSSFLTENNNYGRIASMYYTLYGEGFKAATNGPTGSAAEPLPECIESTDRRFRGAGPRGSAAVSLAGSICQTCHMSRYLMAGSILMRPFSEVGKIYEPGNLVNLDNRLYREAVGSDWTQTDLQDEDKKIRVDRQLLLELLNSNDDICIKSTDGYLDLNKVKDLANYLSRSETSLVQGFARHAHRAFMVSLDANLELLTSIARSYESAKDGSKTLKNLIETYFLSETFACEAVQ